MLRRGVVGRRQTPGLFSDRPERELVVRMRNRAEGEAKQPPQLRRAIAYINDNAHRGITLADIAASVGVTPRSVQYMFRRYLGATPLSYLRDVRLDHAHRDLLVGDPSVDTVTAIACRWGFTHAGRFSNAYKNAFGTTPSRTLRGEG